MRILLILLALSVGAEVAHAEVKGEPVDYKVGDMVLKGYLAYDDALDGKRPGVIVVHEWWGHNAYARKRAEMLAGMGYTALAVDMYGDGKQAAHPDDAGKFAREATRDFAVTKARFMAGVDVLKHHETVNSDHIAAIGYCFGGGVVLEMAQMGMDLDGVVSFHGSLNVLKEAQPGGVKAKILVCHGADDPFIPKERIDAFKKHLDSLKADYEFITYEGAKHSFTNPEASAFGEKFGLPLAYNAEADRQSWAKMQALFKSLWEK